MNFRSRLCNHDRLLGILLTMPLPALAEICADAGFDWLFLDMEHGSLELRDVERIAQTVNDRCPCVVRVPINDRMWIGKVLDLGVSGVIIPQIRNAAEAGAAVHAAKYPPRGGRGIGVGRAARYGANLARYLENADEEIALIAQIEHKDAVANVEAIAGVEGVDALMIGPGDLSASYGKPGRSDDAEVQSAITRVREFAQSKKIPISLFSPDVDGARRALAEGYTLVPVATDGLLFVRAASDMVKTILS